VVFGFERAGPARQAEAGQIGTQGRQRLFVQEAGQVQRTVGIDFRDAGTDEQLAEFVTHGRTGNFARRQRQAEPRAVERLVGVGGLNRVGACEAGEQRVIGRRQQQPRDQAVHVGARLLFLRQGLGHGNKAGGAVFRFRTIRSHGLFLFWR
jgi:hypothetical protein